VAWVLADVEEVDRVVVTSFVGEGVAEVGVLPGLGDLKVLLSVVFIDSSSTSC
jgi:energy-converting hydrogenase Eha subunit G